MSAQSPEEEVRYTARAEYLADEVAANYMTNRFSGILGQYRFSREQRAVNGRIAEIARPEVRLILDCPTGIGRWLPNLATLQPDRIVAVDVSPTMLRRARTVSLDGVSTEFIRGVAEKLPFDDDYFDLVFCHALLKHLPATAQAEVIKELARVTSKYVIVAASVRRGPAGWVRAVRKAKGAVAVPDSWFQRVLAVNDLSVVSAMKATTPLGVEYSYLLRKGCRR
jgi:ubiquinone/menaquinone biosynthesis C-methylase UbiE